MKKWLEEYTRYGLWSSGKLNDTLHWGLRLICLPYYIILISYHCIKGTSVDLVIYK